MLGVMLFKNDEPGGVELLLVCACRDNCNEDEERTEDTGTCDVLSIGVDGEVNKG